MQGTNRKSLKASGIPQKEQRRQQDKHRSGLFSIIYTHSILVTDLEFLRALEDDVAVSGQIVTGVVRGEQLVVEQVDGSGQDVTARRLAATRRANQHHRGVNLQASVQL